MEEFYVLNDRAPVIVPENFKGYVIFFRKNKDTEMANVQLNLLHKLIHNGLKMEVSDFLLADLNEHPLRISVLQKNVSVLKCFLFGVEEKEVGMNFDAPMYQLITVAGIEFLKADAPETLEQNKNLKNKLWSQLQTSFNLHK